jgi:hypothetical protein
MAEEAESSSASSLVGSGGDGILDNSELLTRFEALKHSLACAAAEKTILYSGAKGGKAVISPAIRRMMDAYLGAVNGKVVVVCARSGAGKTHAAEFLMHGDHPLRPEQSLKISAASYDDFPVEFAAVLGVKQAAPFLAEFLCGALTRFLSTALNESSDFSEDRKIRVYGPNPLLEMDPAKCNSKSKLPVLIIDDFEEDTDKNKAFVKKLIQVASQFRVFVFILTAKRSWATTLVGLNGTTSKIKPLYKNVDNADCLPVGPFKGKPEWNDMPWGVNTLRELIRPDCVANGINPDDIIKKSMTPTQALETLERKRLESLFKHIED